MATFEHTLQGSTDTTIADTDTLQFANGTFDGKITVDEYNDSTHVKDDTDSDKSDGNTPNNVKYISNSEADWGDGTENLDQITDAECTLKINFSHDSSVATEDAVFYAYDGLDTANAPDGMTFYAAESGDASWTNAEGSGSALELDDQSSDTSHDFYIAVSAKPDSVGSKSGKYRCELIYS